MKLGGKLEKINPRWEYGIFVGVRRKSGEVWIATREKLSLARSIRRIPVEQRWSRDCVEWVQWVPWNRYRDAPDADGDLPEGVPVVEPREIQSDLGSRPIIIETRERAPREFYIRREDCEKHGYTRGCGGCSSWFQGLSRQPHSEKCRERFREILKGEARVKNAEARRAEFEQREAEKKRKKGGASSWGPAHEWAWGEFQ